MLGMRVTQQELSQFYASLSDEALREIDPDDLSEAARKCYELEAAQRNLTGKPAPAAVDEDEDQEPGPEQEESFEVDPDWLEHAACVCSYRAVPGSSNAMDAAHARDVLVEAGVPCHLAVVPPEPEPDGASRFDEYRVLVPAALNLKAISVLDLEIFNEEMEGDWKTHFAALTDEELEALNPDDLCAGLLDRVERLTRVYNEEVERRNQEGE